jgi:hypothetical protein
MRLLTRVVDGPDGKPQLEDYYKARVSTNLSAGGDDSVNAGVAPHDRQVGLLSVRQIARAAGICGAAFDPPPDD